MDDDRDMRHASNADGKIPNQKELEKELSEYLSKKYGDRIKIISPFVFPQKQENGTDEPRQGRDGAEPAFDLLPEELEFFLDSFVVKQNHAKAVLATKVCTHFNRVKHLRQNEHKRHRSSVGMIKNNVLMIGPTGVGKTYIIKLIAQKLGVPFVKGDATKFSETGYVGGDVEDLVRDLYYEAGEDIERAENGIIYVDEVDKIASAHNIIGHDVSRTGVQRALLKPMEETDVDLKVPHDPIAQIQAIEHYRRTGKKEKRVINTRNILFIMSGAFGGLADIIRKRLQKQGLGFEADVRSAEIPWEILKEVTAQDLIEFGFESEFVGRLPVVVVLDELTEDDLFTILENPNNPIIISKRLDFRAYGIDIKFEEEALRKLAALATAEKTGARGLVSVIEKVLIPFEKKLPSTGIRQFLMTPEVVDRPEQELERILADPDEAERRERFARARDQELAQLTTFIQARAEEFGRRSAVQLTERRIALIAELYLGNVTDINEAAEEFGRMYAQVRAAEASINEKLDMELVFDPGAVDEILTQAIRTDQNPVPLTLKIAKSLEYGLNLVRDRSGLRRFEISAEAIADMDAFINNLIKQTYRQECEAMADLRRTLPTEQ